MRRLTLILSDLYLPAEAERTALRDAASLPHFEWLLRFARSERIDDWRRWLTREFVGGAIANLPAAHLCAWAAGIAPAGSWIATPVRLEARLDHVRLANRGLLRLPREQLATLTEEFATSFGPEALVAAGNARALLLQHGPDDDAVSVDPARLLDADIGPALPAGPGAAQLRRLGAEIEMWLPGTRTNAERQRGRQPPISALWFWGGGRVQASLPASAGMHTRLLGSDFFLAALARLHAVDVLPAAPADFSALGDAADPVCVELAPLSGAPEESLPAIEKNWFAPLRQALQQGRLEELQLVANDRVCTLHARAGWRFWRGRRNWLESLA